MCTSAWFAGAGLPVVEADVEVVLVTLETGDAESSSEFPELPRACPPSSRKMTPRNSTTITMARRGSPVESGTRSFIEPTVARKVREPAKPRGLSGHLKAEAARRTRLLAARSQPAPPLHQHRVGGQRFLSIDQRVEHLVVARRRHREQLFDRVFLDPGVFPPLTFECQDVVFTAGEPIGDL